MKKITRNDISKSFVEKAVVLAIAMIFVLSAFIPAIGSQVKSITTNKSYEESETISVGAEESINNIDTNNREGTNSIDKTIIRSTERSENSDDSLLNGFVRTILGLVNVVGNNPVVNRLRELFTRTSTKEDDVKKDIDHDTNPMSDDQLTTGHMNTLNQSLAQPMDNPDPLPLGAGDPWWNTGWSYRKEITVDHSKVAGNLLNFPVLINITDDDLKDDAQDNGNDVVFTDDSGNKLNHEIEFFNGSTGELVAWVNVTSLSSTVDTVLYMYYGNFGCSSQENIAGVWDSSFVMVQHLNETTGTHYDSTSYGNDGTPYGSLNQDAAGKVDGADDFDGTDDHVQCPQVFSDETQFTIDAWIYPETGARYFVSQWSSNQGAFLQTYTHTNGTSVVQLYVNNYQTGLEISFNSWHHVVGTFDGTTGKIYLDAGAPSSIAASLTWPSENTYIGDRSTFNRQFHGTIDEVRISDIARSASWIKTSYMNQVDPSGFYSIGGEKDVNAPYIYDETPVDGDVNVSLSLSQLSFTLNDYQGDLMNYTVETVPDAGSDSQTNVGGGVKTVPVSDLVGETTYTWFVNVTDGIFDTNKTFAFTTESDRPLVSDEQPGNGSVNVDLNPTLQATIEDLQGDSVDWQIKSNVSGGWSVLNSGTLSSGSGTVSSSSSNMDEYGTMYYWSVNATDTNNNEWTNASFMFTTKPKIILSNPHPSDGGTWVSLNPELSITVNDPYEDSMSVTFRTNASGGWKDIGSYTNIGNGTYNYAAQDMLHRNIIYYWSVNATDNMGWWTNSTYNLTLVDYKGDRVKPIAKAYCWKFPYMRPAKEKGMYIGKFMDGGGGDWAKYDINQGWIKTYEQVFQAGYAGHPCFGFWNNSYHVVNGYSGSPPNPFDIADSPEPNFESFSTVNFYQDSYVIGYNNFTNPTPATYTFDDSNAWIMTGEICNNNNTWVIKAFPWNKTSGWGDGIMLWKTQHSGGWDHRDDQPALLRYNRTTWYLYYVYYSGGSTALRYVKTTDAGETWSDEQTVSDISCFAGGSTRTSFARYGNNFYIFVRDGNGDAVVYNSTDMESWGNKQVIDNSINYWMPHGTMLHQSALICVASSTPYVADQYGMILPISEMLANPDKPTSPYPANDSDLPVGTTTAYLNVTVHGDQVYDVAFYWANGTFIGEDKLLEEGDIASLQISGLQNNTNYEWYAVARGTIDEYIGREPLATSDQNRTETFSFKVKAQPQPLLTDGRPEDGATDINPNPILQVNVTDFQGDNVSWWIKSNVTNSWSTLDSGYLSDGNGTVSVTPSVMDEYSTTYYWSVNTSDGTHWTNETYSFTTICGRPFITDEQPEDGSTGLDLNPMLQATIGDFQGDSVEWWIMSNASGSWSVLNSSSLPDGNGTVIATPSMINEYDTLYYWSVNCSDGMYWENKTYQFTTVRTRPYISNEIPGEDSVGIDLNPVLQATVGDVQGDSVDWWIKTNATNSWSVIHSGTLPNGKGIVTVTPATMEEYNNTYYWSVNTSDGVHWENQTYHFTTKAAPGPWWNDSWLYRKMITINHDFVYANSNLTNLPMLISITDSALAAKVQSLGEDIVFTNYMGTKLNHEIEYYDDEIGHLVAWVNVTCLSSDKETTLYMYYGNTSCGDQENPTAVWNANYTMVHHLEETSGMHHDSTSYTNDGVPHGVTQDAAGWINGADRFNETPESYSAEISISSNGGNGVYTALMNIEPIDGPVLKYSPRSHQFGNMYAGNTASTSFDVWNDGTENCMFSCMEYCDWMNLPGITGGSSHHGGGDVDTVDVEIDTTGLDPGNYSAQVQIITDYVYSDVYTVYVRVIDSPVGSPQLLYDPDSYFFRNMGLDETDSTTFEIWNGGTGTLSYTLSENAEWASVSPTSGSSTGEHDSITVSVDTSNIVVGNYVDVSDDPSLDHQGEEGFTYTAWINSEELDGYKAIVTHRDSSENAMVGLWTLDNNLYCKVRNDGNTSMVNGSAGVDLSESTWYHVGLTRSSTGNIYLWVNGNSYNIGTCTGDITPSESLYVGWHTDGGQNFIGRIDEVRVSNVERDSGWILTSYNNQNNPNEFCTLGIEELNIAAPDVSDEQPENNSIQIDINPLLEARIFDYQGDSVDWWIMSNASGVWTTLDDGTLAHGEGPVSALSGMTDYETTYYWSVNATDSCSWTNRTFSFTTEPEPGAWWNIGWPHRKRIIIDHTMVQGDSPLVNFPVLLNITDDDLFTKAQDDGDDIVFTDYYGNKLHHEIELYNYSNGHLVAWVNVTNLSSTDDTLLYMYYGNLSCSSQENVVGVWDSSFVMVHHLAETTGTHYDSTIYDNDGSPSGGVNQNIVGVIDGADDFDGTNDHISVNDLDQHGDFTLEIWMNPDTLSGSQDRSVIMKNQDYGFEIDHNTEVLYSRVNAGSWTGVTVNVSVDTWQYIVMVWDEAGNDLFVYVNGSLISSNLNMGNHVSNDNLLYIASWSGADQFFDGGIDEVRLSNKTRSAGWINTSYVNQHDPSGFYSVGSEEASNAPTVSDENPKNGAINVLITLSNLSFVLEDPQGDMMNYTVVTSPNIGSDSQNDKSNGTYNISVGGLNYETTYTWYVNVTDGTHWTNRTYSFTTVSDMPVVSDEYPVDNSVNQPLIPILSIHVEDLQGDNMNIQFRTNASGTWQTIGTNNSVGNGTYYCDNTTDMNNHGTLYYWSVNASDTGGSGKWVNNTYSFTTKQKVVGPYAAFPELGNEFVAIEYSGSCWDASGHGPHSLDVLTLNKNGHPYWGYYGCRTSASGVGVAYSDDLENWTRYSCTTPLITGVRWPTVGIQNDTIHMFYNRGSVIRRATSPITDGINFTEVESVTGSPAVTPFLFKNPVDDEWWLFWTGPTSTYNAKHAKDIRDLDAASQIVVRIETTISAWAPSVLYWNNTYYFTHENEPGGVWQTRAFYNSTLGPNCFNDDMECTNSPILTDEAACGMAHIESNRLYYFWSYKFNDGSDLWNVKGAKSVEIRETSPIITEYSPVDGEVDQPLSPVLSVSVKDLQHDSMNLLFRTNASGSWQTIGGNISVGDGTYTCGNTSDMNSYSTTYYWSVHVTDSGSWTNRSYSFTTAGQDPPIVSNPIPSNGSINQPLTPMLSITVSDVNSDSMNITFRSNASGSWKDIGINTSVYDGTYICDNTSDMNTYNTIYYWTIHVTDGISWTNATFSFTTAGQNPPIVSNPAPSNGSINQPLTTVLSITVSDVNSDSMNITFRSNASGSWKDIGINTSVYDGTYICDNTSDMNTYNTIYYWSVHVTDGISWTNATYSFTTAGQDSPIVSNPAPSNNSINQPLTPILSITVSDVNSDSMNITFRSNASGSWKDIGINTSVYDGTYTCSNTSDMSDYNTAYYWSVHVTDGASWTNRSYHFTTEPVPGGWWNTNWSYRKQVTINHTQVFGDSPLLNFPVLVDITDGNLSSKAQSDGDDIVFTDYYGNKLSHEIEYYENSSGHLIAWVNVTSLSDTIDTVLYMYYGNSSCVSQENIPGVWNSDYVMVQHLNETSGIHYDSTSYGNNGTQIGGVTQDSVGKVDGCDDFDGSDDYLNVADDDSLTPGTELTLSAWVNVDVFPTQGGTYKLAQVAGKWAGADDDEYFLDVNDNGKMAFAWHTTGSDTWGNPSYNLQLSSGGISTDVWAYIVAVRDDTDVRFYINGNLDSEFAGIVDSNPFRNGVNPVRIGAENSTPAPRFLNGLIDEVQVSDIVRGSGWIKTCFNNQQDPDAFMNVGVEETPSADTVPPEISNLMRVMSDPLDTDPAFGWENISCTVTDNVDVDEVLLNVTYPDLHMANLLMTDVGGGIYYCNITFSDVGSYSYFIWANDTSDNVNISSVDSFEIPPNYDIFVDGKIDIMDINRVSLEFGNSCDAGSIREDVDNSGMINIMDINLVSLHFGETW